MKPVSVNTFLAVDDEIVAPQSINVPKRTSNAQTRKKKKKNQVSNLNKN